MLPTGGTVDLHAGTQYSNTESMVFNSKYWSDAVTGSLTQPLLKGFGPNSDVRRQLYLSEANEYGSQATTFVNASSTIATVADAYWDLVQAWRNVAIQEEALHSFDLVRGPLLRARVLHLAEREHLLLISLHQSICDGWSLGVLVEELTALYDAFSAGQQTPLTPLPIQYTDFARWQRQWRSYPEIGAQLAYWREQLHGVFRAAD